jgi:hypothetical protein
MTRNIHGLRAVLAVAFLGAAASLAQADLNGHPLVVTATTSTGLTSTWNLTETMGQFHGPDWHFNSSSGWSYNFWSQGQLLGTISNLNVSIIADPQVNVSFTATAGVVDTSFTFSSTLLSFPAFAGGTAQASAGITVADLNGNGVTLTGNNPGGFAYRADYNGVVPTGTNYASFFPSVTGDPSSGNSVSANLGPTFIPASVGDMSARFAFTLSAGDLASGTSNFEIVPAPAGAVALGLGLLGVSRRRR